MWFARALLYFYVRISGVRVYCLREKLHTYFGYNGRCPEDYVYKSYVRIYVRKLVLDGLNVNELVTYVPDISNSWNPWEN